MLPVSKRKGISQETILVSLEKMLVPEQNGHFLELTRLSQETAY